jgi:hypothetical protein
MGEEQSPKVEVSEQVGTNFFKATMIATKFPAEFALTINLQAILGYYVSRIGVPPLVSFWEEIRALTLWGINNIKQKNVEKLPFVIRFTGGGAPVWLVMKLYALVVYECDSVYVAGDILIKI